MTHLVDAGLVSKDWQNNKYKGIVTNSVVSIVTRPGNPEGIESFQDIIDKDVSVVTPNPFTSPVAPAGTSPSTVPPCIEGKSEQEALTPSNGSSRRPSPAGQRP